MPTSLAVMMGPASMLLMPVATRTSGENVREDRALAVSNSSNCSTAGHPEPAASNLEEAGEKQILGAQQRASPDIVIT